jgi:hypothetical protein
METLCMLTYLCACSLSLFHSSFANEKLSAAKFLAGGFFLLFHIVILTADFLHPKITGATVLVPVSETDLTQHAAAIVIGTVKQIESYWDPHAGHIFTHITVSPQDILKGSLAQEDLVLKQHGGTVGSRHMWIEGSPSFTRGEKVLVFVDRNADGSARVDQLYLGKFSLFTDKETGKEFAYRGDTPTGVRILSQSSKKQSTFTPFFNEFLEVAPMKERIQAILQSSSSIGISTAEPFISPLIPLHSESEQREGFVLIRPIPVRWFEPDAGEPVTLLINPNHIFPNGEERINAGIEAWSGLPRSTFSFRLGGQTEAEGFRQDDVSAISFADPLDQLTNPIDCTGILAAVALTSISDESRTMHEQTFFRIAEADLVFADGWENCREFQDPTNLDEATTHELGHIVGLGHSPNPEAIMFAFARFDGRGARLAQEDKDGVAFLYPDSTFPPCTYSLSSSKRSVSSSGTVASVQVRTSERCGWTAFSGTDWITITEGESSSGNGTVEIAISANTGRKSRQATLFIAGKVFTITQKGGGIGSSRRWVPPFARG